MKAIQKACLTVLPGIPPNTFSSAASLPQDNETKEEKMVCALGELFLYVIKCFIFLLREQRPFTFSLRCPLPMYAWKAITEGVLLFLEAFQMLL